ncbi:MAG: protease HtpX [Bdellovibrionales bacterium]|nr:protease HtpX [Bdellovibrionales bacterium]
MKIAKRVFLFVTVNILIIATLSVIMSVFGIQPYLTEKGINYSSLILLCAVWGFGGAFLSLALSRKMAKWMMGVKVINANEPDQNLNQLVHRVHSLARKSGIEVMPEVGIYESPEINAFATGPTKNRSLVAVSTGLLAKMDHDETEGVLAHEVAHIANGDMVTMTLVQGVVNAFVMFLARIIANVAAQFVDEDKRTMVQFGIVIALEVVLGMLGMIVVSAFSRHREYRADEGGANLSSPNQMIAALEKLKRNYHLEDSTENGQPALATMKISGKAGGFLKLFSTHPDLDDRIARLQQQPSRSSRRFAKNRSSLPVFS